MSQIPHTSPFDGIRHEDEHGKEFWSAREFYKLLGYTRWEKFQKSIEEAKIACQNSNQAVSDHFHLEVQLIKAGIRRDQVSNKGHANVTHYMVGQEVREAIKRLGGTMPEDLPTPEKSIQELQHEEEQRLKSGHQLSLLDESDRE